MTTNKDKIQTFWKWFVENENIIKNCIENGSATERAYVVDNLNDLILDLGLLTWDLGLNDTNEWFLTISPNCNKELFEISEEIIRNAPYELDWIFHSAKPPKKWERTFMVYNDFMDEIHIDASTWQYVALNDPDNKIKLIFEAKNIIHLDEETTETAANMFLVNEIGERELILRVSTIEIVSELDAGLQKEKCSVTNLKSIFL